MFNRLVAISQINLKNHSKTIAMGGIVFVGLLVLMLGINIIITGKNNDHGMSDTNQGVNNSVNLDDSLDSDNDGLPDNLEKLLGIDINKPDSDNDGYNDLEEVKNGYSPLTASPSEKISPDEFGKIKTFIRNFNAELYDKIFVKNEENITTVSQVPAPSVSPAISPAILNSPTPSMDPSPIPSLVPAVLKEKNINKNWIYILYIPAGYDSTKAYPLVLVFYMAGGVISDSVDNWRAEADKNGYIIAALEPYEKKYPSGNVVDSYPWEEASDFASSVLSDIQEDYKIDQKNIFLSGYSTGAATSYIVALDSGIKFKGIIPIGGYLPLEAGIVNKLINSDGLNFYVIHGANDSGLKAIIAQEKTLIQYGAKMNFITIPDFETSEYPIVEQENIAKWMNDLMWY